MKKTVFAIGLSFAAAAGSVAGPVAAAIWDGGGSFFQVQSQRGREGGGGREAGREARGGGPERRESRPERQHDDRRERMSEDDRRSLHRDLDKANRELYGRRFPK